MTEPDLSELEALSQPHRGRCGVQLALAELPPKDRAVLAAALRRPWAGQGGITHQSIKEWLKKRGVHVNADGVGNHRRRMCRCPAPEDSQ